MTRLWAKRPDEQNSERMEGNTSWQAEEHWAWIQVLSLPLEQVT